MSKPVASTWYACRTNPNCEARAAASLRLAGYGVYAPTFNVEYWHRRKTVFVTRTYNLMPGYILVDVPRIPVAEYWAPGTRPSWFRLRRCDGVKEVLGIRNVDGELVPHPIPSRMVEAVMVVQHQMRREFDAARAVRMRSKKTRADVETLFPAGTAVQIKAEPFDGHHGTVDHVTSRGAVAVLVELFGRMTPFEVEHDQIDRQLEAA